MAADRMMVAIETFATAVTGEDRMVFKDRTRVRDSDPLYKANPGAFREIEDYPSVEQATAGPGERRGPGRPRQQKGS